jgi:glycerol-3-phosphate acyltransferase PlsY
MALSLVLIVALSYLLGAVPFSLIVGRLKGVDLRQHGSGNAGATNAFRVLGKGPGALVFALDLLKGLAATLGLSRLHLGADPSPLFGAEGGVWLMVIAGAAAMVGHVFTLWGRLFFGSFKGGKGVATGAGMLVGLIPVAVGVGLAVFIATMAATRYVSLGSILAALSLPATLGVQRALGAEVPGPVWLFALAVPLFILWTHRTNVRRLLNGTEPTLSAAKATGLDA